MPNAATLTAVMRREGVYWPDEASEACFNGSGRVEVSHLAIKTAAIKWAEKHNLRGVVSNMQRVILYRSRLARWTPEGLDDFEQLHKSAAADRRPGVSRRVAADSVWGEQAASR